MNTQTRSTQNILNKPDYTTMASTPPATTTPTTTSPTTTSPASPTSTTPALTPPATTAPTTTTQATAPPDQTAQATITSDTIRTRMTQKVYKCFWTGCDYKSDKKSGAGRHSARCLFRPESKGEIIAKFDEMKTKVWLCPECEGVNKIEAYGRPSDLKSHRILHFKENLAESEFHQCQCGYKTTDKSNFKKHQKGCKILASVGDRSTRRGRR